MTCGQALSDEKVAIRRQRRLEAMTLQEIEGNPLTQDEVAMFEMFDHERWSDERCRAFILATWRDTAMNLGAEAADGA